MSLKKLALLTILTGLCTTSACESSQIPTGVQDFDTNELPIVNGTQVTGNDYASTVALVLIKSGQVAGAACTGTLITPNYVMLAAHCIEPCQDDTEDKIERRPYTYIGIGNAYKKLSEVYPIEEFIAHPDYKCDPLENDIALLKLKKSVPFDVAVPTPPLIPELALTAQEVDSNTGVDATSVGFGKIDALDDDSMGVKYETTRKIYAVCPLKGNGSKKCADSTYTQKKGILYLDATNSATCQGDSGGPTFVEKNGHTYVAGVTSYGYGKCSIINGMTLVTDYYDFLREHVDILPAAGDENCSNGIDDNGDGLIDCKDPYCFGNAACFEDCSNQIDDNGNGLIDCKDPLCAEETHCKTEICNNGIDDNGDGLTDCQDPTCATHQNCQPENCSNKIDDNGDGLIDCQDPKCASDKSCQQEICNDKIDNNGNGLIDCLDPQCASDASCQQEICNDKIDNNGDGLIDCLDPQCASDKSCQTEICNDNIDNNGNGLIDCLDPQCAAHLYCQREICNDTIDNNGNGLIDCQDPACANDIACKPEICDDDIDNNGNGLIDCQEASCAYECSQDNASGCSISQKSNSPWASLLVAFATLGLFGLRRRKQS